MRIHLKRKPCALFVRLFLIFVAIAAILSTISHLLYYKTIDTAGLLSGQDIKLLIDAESINAKRIGRVQKVCSKYNLGLFKNSAEVSLFKHPPTPQYSVFYIDKGHKLAWCPVYKAASSSMLHNLCLLGGFTEQFLGQTTQQLSTIARKIYPELDYPQAEEALQSCLKVIIVRHPFERLLSAYRDKLENVNVRKEHGSVHFYQSYGSKIVERFRVGGNKTKTEEVLRPGTYHWQKDQPKPAGFEPTFQEFVRYLISTDLLSYADDHWIPYYLFCTPCLLKYDFIAKVETLFRDQMYIIRALDVQQIIKPTWKHQTKGSHSIDTISKAYFSQLTRLQIEKLYKKYKLDFELFDYIPDVYYNYALD
ncbi:carbohydrate sulfotransferase 11 isoform X2 [Nilaparvata lugens]|uniref:carbohydrate sulfotransferase 11 isoform X2 n=1 Tax=Nilaparvata lugens TaxID=108931 RepID=UPI000B992A43|nr:carbohydrate sulfotransferase 11 isoform X2 [Nilaparvata lugens]XP_039297167.1 carbohydrate sulfotransferase 11 isoform X2 [Nilaparvata lugens]